MKFAILAAGEGSRLSEEGVSSPKPLVKLNGETMIDRLIRIFLDNDAEEIIIITNNLTKLVQEHIGNMIDKGLPLRLLVKTTPSSMHSFYELSKCLGDGKFCLTTVDTIFDEREFKEYISVFKQSASDGMMAVTDFVDDEKPLYISTDADQRITGFFDSLNDFDRSEVAKTGLSQCNFISGGIYCLDSKCFSTLGECMRKGMARMRNFQRQLVYDGLNLDAFRFSKILDVDHFGDIAKAEQFLNSCR